MSSVSIDEAQAKLSELIHELRPGDEILITEGKEPVARLLPAAPQGLPKRRQLGTLRGTVIYIAPDFDAPLEDFKEYME
jgi:prevent-host-death family protein